MYTPKNQDVLINNNAVEDLLSSISPVLDKIWLCHALK